jgi:hypothetical protein
MFSFGRKAIRPIKNIPWLQAEVAHVFFWKGDATRLICQQAIEGDLTALVDAHWAFVPLNLKTKK